MYPLSFCHLFPFHSFFLYIADLYISNSAFSCLFSFVSSRSRFSVTRLIKLDSFIQDVLSDPSFEVCCVDPELYAIPKNEIIAECISDGYTVEEREDGILNIS